MTGPLSTGPAGRQRGNLLLVEKGRYFEALGAYREGDAAPIVDQLNHAALRAVSQGRRFSSRPAS